jgi:hypothetical protein
MNKYFPVKTASLPRQDRPHANALKYIHLLKSAAIF